MNLSGKKILVDPVFYQGSPVSFVNKMFKGTDVYKPADMPDIDYLVISHDHWDHLDYRVVTELANPLKTLFLFPIIFSVMPLFMTNGPILTEKALRKLTALLRKNATLSRNFPVIRLYFTKELNLFEKTS